MARPAPPQRAHSLPQSAIAALAASVGHELNNIAVPLDGFAELTLQNLQSEEPARQNLDEMRIAIGRMKDLALELESLGESESRPTRATIGDCMPWSVPSTMRGPWKVEWLCSASIGIFADSLHAQRAIQSLARVAALAGEEVLEMPLITVSQEPLRRAKCATCDAWVAGKNKTVWIHAHMARPLVSQALREPFGAAKVSRIGQRLTLAVLVHCIHCAGGHVLLDEPTGRLSLALPAA